jgi:Ca2+-dependent lipid-binding protein
MVLDKKIAQEFDVASRAGTDVTEEQVLGRVSARQAVDKLKLKLDAAVLAGDFPEAETNGPASRSPRQVFGQAAMVDMKKKLDAVIQRGSDLTEEQVKEMQEDLGDVMDTLVDEEDNKKLEAIGPGIIDHMWDRVDSVRHLLVASFLCYAVGYYGFHWFWVIIAFAYVYSLDYSYKQRGFSHFYRLKKLKSKEKSKDAVEESAAWFNNLMLAAWPNLSNRVAVETRRFMVAYLETLMLSMQGGTVQGCYVRNVAFGHMPPQIKLLRPQPMKKEFPSRYVLDLTLHYAGELEVTVVAVVAPGGAKVKVPITITNITVMPEMQIQLDFFPHNPHLKSMDIAFRQLQSDWLSFDIKLLGGLNVLSLHAIKAWVMDLITDGIKGAMLLPKTVHVNLAEGVEEEDAAKKAAEKPDDKFVIPLKQGERNPFVEYKGHVRVTVVGKERPAYIGRPRCRCIGSAHG